MGAPWGCSRSCCRGLLGSKCGANLQHDVIGLPSFMHLCFMCALIFYHTTAVTVKLVQDVQCATSKFLVFWHWIKICNKNYATHSQDFGLQKKWKLCILQLCTPPHCDHGTGEKPLSTPPKKQFPLLNKVLQNGETCVTSHENALFVTILAITLDRVCVCGCGKTAANLGRGRWRRARAVGPPWGRPPQPPNSKLGAAKGGL